MHKKAFTLVELIVVITILAVLGTIAFVSFQWYTQQSRNSVRISDVKMIEKILSYYFVENYHYPLPESPYTLSYSWADVLHQWTFGEAPFQKVKRMSNIPVDPLTKTEYLYSVINSKKQYEILTIFEGQVVQNTPFSQSYAASWEYQAKVQWTYNKIFVKTDYHYIPLPSIINAEVTSATALDQNNIKSFIVTDGDNLPEWWDKLLAQTGGLDINLSPFTGSVDNGLTDFDKQNITLQIQQAYTGSQLENQYPYTEILSKTQSEELITFANEVVLDQGRSSSSSSSSPSSFNSCTANPTYTINGHTYNLPIIDHATPTVLTSANITQNNGIFNYTVTIDCNNGTIQAGVENPVNNISCNTSYLWDGTSCVNTWPITLNNANLFNADNGIRWEINPIPWITVYQYSNNGTTFGQDRSTYMHQDSYATSDVNEKFDTLKCGTPHSIWVRAKVWTSFTSPTKLNYSIPCFNLPTTVTYNGKVRDNLPIWYHANYQGIWKKIGVTVTHYRYTVLRHTAADGSKHWARLLWNVNGNSYTAWTFYGGTVTCPANKIWVWSFAAASCNNLTSWITPNCYNKPNRGNANPQQLWDAVPNNSWICMKSWNYAVAYYKTWNMVSWNCTQNTTVYHKLKVLYTENGTSWINPKNPTRNPLICNNGLSTDITKWSLSLSWNELWPNAEAGTPTLFHKWKVRTSGYFQNWPAENIDRGVASFHY